MKKSIFMIVAAGLMTLAACGNKSENKAAENDSTAVEQAEATEAGAEAAETADATQAGPCTIEFDMFSVDVPEGWKVLKKDSHELKIGTGNDYYNDEQMRFEEHTYQNLDDQIKVMKGLNDVKDLGKQKHGEYNFLAYESPVPELTLLIKGNDKNEYALVEVSRAAYQGEAYKQILASMKMKQL
ncbi:MAG: hypothetical protein IK120_05185 [Muribaculaceae bacterium]|nr:hypothetical protein [Muribaculaceae bacterium]